jgi:probable HAF family extracellular repeat protein
MAVHRVSLESARAREEAVMITRFRAAHLACLAVLGLAAGVPAATAAAAPAAAATTYTVTDPGSLGYGVSDANAINATGQVTGRSYTGATITLKTCCGGCYPGGPHNPCKEHIYHAFVWSNGTMTDLGTLGSNFSEGVAINRSGEVVGWAQTKAGSSDSFLWNGKRMVDLGSAFRAYGINDSGQMAGSCTSSTGSYPCVVSNGAITALPDPPKGSGDAPRPAAS